MLMNYHIGRLVLSSLCVGDFGAAGFRWCSFCRLKPAKRVKQSFWKIGIYILENAGSMSAHVPEYMKT